MPASDARASEHTVQAQLCPKDMRVGRSAGSWTESRGEAAGLRETRLPAAGWPR